MKLSICAPGTQSYKRILVLLFLYKYFNTSFVSVFNTAFPLAKVYLLFYISLNALCLENISFHFKLNQNSLLYSFLVPHMSLEALITMTR